MRDMMTLLALIIVISFPIHVILWLKKSSKLQQAGCKKMVRFFLLFFHFVCVGCSLLIILIGLSGRLTVQAKQSEAKTNLGAIYEAQRAYFSDHNTYAGGDQAFQILGWEPLGQTRYAYYCDSAVIPNLLGRAEIPMPNKNWPVETKPASSQTGFTCMAVGNDDIDETLDVWSINDAKILRNDLNDVNCPYFWERWTK